MKIRNISKNKFEIRKGSLAATVLLTARNGNWYYRSQGSDKKVAAKTSNKDEALAIAANRIFDKQPETSAPKDVSIGMLCDRHWQATQRGEIENAKGKPIEFQHSKQIRWAAEKLCGTKQLNRIRLSDFAEKINGLSKPISKFKAKLFLQNQTVIQQGDEYQKAAGTFNRTLRNFKSLLKPELAETCYSDLELDHSAIATIRNAKLKKLEHKRFKAADKDIMQKLDLHYKDTDSFTRITKQRMHWNIYVRYWLARCCGLRKSEIINSRHEWLVKQDDQWFINVTHTSLWQTDEARLEGWSSKSSNSRMVPIPNWLAAKIRSEKKTDRPDEPILHIKGSCKIHSGFDEAYRREWRNALDKVGADVESFKKPTHHLRGEFVTSVAHLTGSVVTAQAYAGHSDPLTTSRHYFDPTRVKKNVVIDPLGQSLS